jgi:multicomponent Na+:H+ antiporter subunit A
MITGGITMVYAAVHAPFRTDLKGILAYSTISALGMLVFLTGIGTEEAFTAAAVFILVHALYKAALFLVAGTIDHETGTRDVTNWPACGKCCGPWRWPACWRPCRAAAFPLPSALSAKT